MLFYQRREETGARSTPPSAALGAPLPAPALNGIAKMNGKYELIQVNLCQKLLFLHQLTHNMTTDCSLNYKFNTWKFQAQNMGRTCCVQKLFLTFRTIFVHNMLSPCSAKRRASDKDLPVCTCSKMFSNSENQFFLAFNSSKKFA